MIDGLKTKHRQAIIETLAAYERVERAVLFGSRAQGTFSVTSDIDIALFGDNLNLRDLIKLMKDMDSLTIPQQIDLLLHNSIHNSALLKEIRLHGVEWYRQPKGEKDWQKAYFGECAILIRDNVLPSEVENTTNYIGLQHIAENALLLKDCGQAGDVVSLKTRFQTGDILFGKLRPYFRKVIRAPFDGICSTDIWVVQPTSPDIDDRYLFYVMASQEFVDLATLGSEGTRMPRAKWEHVSRFEVFKPPLNEQKAIANALGTLDDKIELNRRMNETLEEMVRALFKSWFVDFDPVRAKIDGRWQPGQSLPGLPAELYHLFPNRLVPSEIGKIPEGWHVESLQNCFDITMGQSPPGYTYNETGKGLPFFQGRKDFGFRYPTNRKYCTKPTRIANPEDTLISVRAPVGDINMAWERCCIGRGVASLRHKQGLPSFTYYTTWSLAQQFNQYEHTGTVFGSINKRQFETIKVLHFDAELCKAFERLVKPLDERIRKNTNESRMLTVIRDSLLPKLLSGEIRVNADWKDDDPRPDQ